MTETSKNESIVYKVASTVDEFNNGKILFQQYASSLDIDLSFQGFGEELNSIMSQYNKPKGALLLAYKDDLAVGCAGIRPLEQDIAELKRMFVRPEFRQFNIGKKLLMLAIDIAADLNYKAIRLDTLPTMTIALSLYRSSGFYEIGAYRFNPIEGAIYMERKL